MFSYVYDENFRNWLEGLLKDIQKYDVVTEKQAASIIKNNIDAFEDCFYDGMTTHAAYWEYANDE